MKLTDLKRDELILIERLRSAPKYSTFTIEKRPTTQFPEGEINRITITESILLKDIALKSI